MTKEHAATQKDDRKAEQDAQVREALKAMPDAFLLCREQGHALQGWDRAVRERWRVDGRDLVHIKRTCQCCETVRSDVLDEHTLELISRSYDRAEGYDSVVGRIRRGQVRRELMRRFLVD